MTVKTEVSATDLAATLDYAILLRKKSFDSRKGKYKYKYIQCAREACDNFGIDQTFAEIIVLTMIGTRMKQWIGSNS